MAEEDTEPSARSGTPSAGELDDGWVVVAGVAELRRRRKRVVEGPHGDVVVFWNDGSPTALANICIHQERELARGTIFDGRVVCPGHQWAFDLTTGYCAERDRTQPVFAVRVVDETVQVDPTATINGVELGPVKPRSGRDPDPA
jgi:nitrite reductase (NADH) small subunit